MSTISNERLEKLSEYDCADRYEVMSMATELLALRKEREAAVPVACLYHTGQVLTRAECNDDKVFAICCKVETPLYATPPAQPVEVQVCPKCGDTGMADSGGVQPWGEPILIECDCTAPPAPSHENVHYADAAEEEIAALRKRIAELETAQTATVVHDAATAIRACLDEFPESVHDIVEECADIAENASRAAIIQSAMQPCDKCGLTGIHACMGGMETDTTSQQFESLAGKVVVPEGWKLVPVELTKEMRGKIHPFAEALCHGCGREVVADCEDNVTASWNDMLAVAPSPAGKQSSTADVNNDGFECTPVADLYELLTKCGECYDYTTSAKVAADWIKEGYSAREYVKLDRLQEALIFAAPEQCK